jgi:hypothetical protein
VKFLRYIWAWFLRAPKEDAAARIDRVLEIAKKRGAATLAYRDPVLGEVHLAMYQTVTPTQLDPGKQKSAEDIIREQLRVMVPGSGMDQMPIPKPRPGTERHEEAGFDG